MNTNVCARGHEAPTRDQYGACVECRRENQRRYRQRMRDAYRAAKAGGDR